MKTIALHARYLSPFYRKQAEDLLLKKNILSKEEFDKEYNSFTENVGKEIGLKLQGISFIDYEGLNGGMNLFLVIDEELFTLAVTQHNIDYVIVEQ